MVENNVKKNPLDDEEDRDRRAEASSGISCRGRGI